MKKTNAKKRKKKISVQSEKALLEVIANAAKAEKLVMAAHDHLRLVKSEHKQARKAYRQAKKHVKRMRKEAKLAAKALKSLNKNRAKPAKAKRAASKSSGARKPKPTVTRLPASQQASTEVSPSESSTSTGIAAGV